VTGVDLLPYLLSNLSESSCIGSGQGQVGERRGRTGPKFVSQLPPLVGADRALFCKSGKVYIAARVSEEGSTGILVFAPKNGGFEMERVETQDIMGTFHRPQGLYLYPGGSEGWSYFVNEFPFDVHRVKVE